MYRILLSTQFYTLVCIGKKEGKKREEGEEKEREKGRKGKKNGDREQRKKREEGKEERNSKANFISTMKLQIEKRNAQE